MRLSFTAVCLAAAAATSLSSAFVVVPNSPVRAPLVLHGYLENISAEEEEPAKSAKPVPQEGQSPFSSGGASCGPALLAYMKEVRAGLVPVPSGDAFTAYLNYLKTGDVAPPKSSSELSAALEHLTTEPSEPYSWSPPTGYLDAIKENCDFENPSPNCALTVVAFLNALASGDPKPREEKPAVAGALAARFDSWSPFNP